MKKYLIFGWQAASLILLTWLLVDMVVNHNKPSAEKPKDNIQESIMTMFDERVQASQVQRVKVVLDFHPERVEYWLFVFPAGYQWECLMVEKDFGEYFWIYMYECGQLVRVYEKEGVASGWIGAPEQLDDFRQKGRTLLSQARMKVVKTIPEVKLLPEPY